MLHGTAAAYHCATHSGLLLHLALLTGTCPAPVPRLLPAPPVHQAAAPAAVAQACARRPPGGHQHPPEPSIPHGIHVTIEGNVLIQNSKVNIGYNV